MMIEIIFSFQVVVIHVGTNNVDDTAEHVADAIVAIVNETRARLPEAYILVVVSSWMEIYFSSLRFVDDRPFNQLGVKKTQGCLLPYDDPH